MKQQQNKGSVKNSYKGGLFEKKNRKKENSMYIEHTTILGPESILLYSIILLCFILTYGEFVQAKQ